MSADILTITNHDRNIFQGKYIYPVVSRRAGGLSLGINLNTNNACNWQCIYCEIPNLSRGKPEPIDLFKLENELDYWLNEIINKSFLDQYTGTKTEFKDIAFSGNGEPTASEDFGAVTKILIQKISKFNLNQKIKIRLITNGSYISNPNIQKALTSIKKFDSEVWFKIDQVRSKEVKAINQINISITSLKKNLEASLSKCPTIIQTCLFRINKKLQEQAALDAYINFLKPYEKKIKGIHLYSLARPSEQPSKDRLTRLTQSEIEDIAVKIQALNIPINIYS
tara:strand:+ start:5217 stop:6059 length:843 start_codon:yes stop_codon:yes gene_type:complete